MKRLLVTGSNGLIGSEMVRHFHRPRLGGARHRQQHARRLLRPAGRHALEPAAASAGLSGLSPSRARHPRSRRRAGRWSTDCGPHAVIHTAAQPSHDLAAHAPVRRLRRERRGHAQPARSREAELPRVAVRAPVDEQGLRRRAEPDRAEGAADALGLRRSRVRATASRRTFRSTSPSTRCSARRRWPATSWCRSMAATSAFPPAACAADA